MDADAMSRPDAMAFQLVAEERHNYCANDLASVDSRPVLSDWNYYELLSAADVRPADYVVVRCCYCDDYDDSAAVFQDDVNERREHDDY